jgi:hypothetical protein
MAVLIIIVDNMTCFEPFITPFEARDDLLVYTCKSILSCAGLPQILLATSGPVGANILYAEGCFYFPLPLRPPDGPFPIAAEIADLHTRAKDAELADSAPALNSLA